MVVVPPVIVLAAISTPQSLHMRLRPIKKFGNLESFDAITPNKIKLESHYLNNGRYILFFLFCLYDFLISLLARSFRGTCRGVRKTSCPLAPWRRLMIGVVSVCD